MSLKYMAFALNVTVNVTAVVAQCTARRVSEAAVPAGRDSHSSKPVNMFAGACLHMYVFLFFFFYLYLIFDIPVCNAVS